jgi:hypothetical protein
MYYYKVRTIGAGGIPSPFSATLTASTLSFIVSVNFNDFLNAPAPWNNLPNSLSVDSPPFSLRNSSGNLTGLLLTCTDNFNGTNTSGMNTGNNSGVYPDAVIRGFNYIETGAHAKLLISGLNHSYGYNFTFFGSRQGTSGDRTCVYTIGSKSVSLNALGNTTQTVSINEVRPQDNGTILIDLYAPTTSGYGYINAIVIQGYAVDIPGSGQPAGRLASPVAANETATVVEDESSLLKWTAYPNPFEDKINLIFPQEVTGTIQFELYEPNGRKITGRRIDMENSSSTEIDLSATPLNSGLHLIKIVDQKGRMSVVRVVRKN